MKIAFNPSTVGALIAPPNNKDITFDLRGHNIFARGVKFCGTDTNTWRDIKINNVSIDSNILDLRDGDNTTLTNINGVVAINSTWRPVVDNLTSDSTTSSLSANQGRVLKALIDDKSDSGHTHDDRYLKLTGGWMSGDINFGGDNKICWGRNTDSASISFKNDGDGDTDSYMSFVTSDNGNEYFRWSHSSGSTNTEWMALRSDGLRVGGTKVSLEGHSHNDLYYTKTEVNNKLNGKSDTSHTHDDRYLKLTGGTMSGTIYRNSGGATISGRDNAIIRQTYAPGGSSWNPIACVDTETGTWTLGHLSSGDSDTNFHFCFSTNTDYNAGNNNGNYVTLRNKVGTIALLSEIPDKNSWNYDDRYLKLTGGTMNGNARIGHGSGNLYIGNSGNDGWLAVQDICSQDSIGDGKWSIRVDGTASFQSIKFPSNRLIAQVSSGSNSPLKGIKLPDLQSNGIGIFSRVGNDTDEGGIILSEDTCVIYNSFDTGWGLSVRDKDINQTDISGDNTIAFGIRQDYRAYSLGGFEKSGSDNSYVLLGGGGHKAENALNVSNADTVDGEHASAFVKIKQFRFSQYNQGTWTKILTITINSTTDLQPVIAFSWIPSECSRTIWADFSINWRSNSPIFYAIWKGMNSRTLKVVNSSGAIWDVWVSGNKTDWDPFGEIQVTYTHNITSYNGGNLGYSDVDPGGTICITGGQVNYANSAGSATKLATARTIWGQSFDGTADVNGTIYINNNNSSEGAIRLNNNINSNARISAIDDQVIFNTGAPIRFGETSWDWNQWAGLKYTHSNKTIYLGIADGSIFNSNSSQSGGTLNLRAGISNIDLNSGTSIRGLPTNGSPYSSRIALYDTSISLSAYGGISMSTGPGAIELSSGYGGIKLSCQGNNASIDSEGFKVEASRGVYLNSGNSGNVYLCQGGKVGIGTTSPTYKLHVAGDIYTTTGFKKNGSSDSYVLLGGGGHSKITDLSVANADTVDGYHANSLLTALSNSDNGISITVGGTTKSVSNISVNYASSAGNADTVDYYHADSLFRDLGWWNYNDTHDADNISGNGAVFAYAEHSNVPNTGVLVTFKGGNDGYRWQMSKSYWSKSLHIRQRNGDNGTWSNWLRLLDESDLIWDNIAGKPSSFTPSAHSHSWTSITDKIVAGNEFNIVNAGFNAGMWFNYLPINDRSKTATITGYHFGNGATGYTSITASGFVKNGSSSNYVLLGDGGHQTISSLSVNYANSAGNADTAQYLRSLGNQNCQTGRTQNYGDVYTYNTYANNTGAPTDYTSVIGFGRGTAGTVEIAGGWCNSHLYWRSLRDCCEDWYSWRVVLDSSNYTEFINNYYWADVKISTSSSTTTSPTVSNLTATNSIRMGNILLEHTDEINNSTNGGIHLNYRNSGNITLCYGGGNVGIETPSPTYKLDVNGQVRASGFRHSSVNSDNYMLLAGGGYKSFGGNYDNPIFLGYLNLDHGSDGTVSSSFYCLGYSVPFTYTRGGNYCRISIPDTSYQVFYIRAAIASVNYSGGGMDTWTGNRRGDGAWWLHCYASSSNEVRVKGFRQNDTNNDSWWGGNPLIPDSGGANRITVCIFGYVSFR